MCRFVPDCHLPAYSALTPQHLTERGIRLLLLDVDNTLAPYEQAEPDERLAGWLEQMAQAGIRCAIVSNNHSGRIELFARHLSLPVYSDAHKPLPGAFRRVMRDLGAAPGECAALGDQIFTDVWAARAARLAWVCTVPPIRDKRDLLTRFKRLLEKPVMRAYRRREAKAARKNR